MKQCCIPYIFIYHGLQEELSAAGAAVTGGGPLEHYRQLTTKFVELDARWRVNKNRGRMIRLQCSVRVTVPLY